MTSSNKTEALLGTPLWNAFTLERIVLLADLLLKALKQGQYGRFIGMLRQNHKVFGVGIRLEVLIYLPRQRLS